MACRICVKRVYEPADPADGRRVLVDRLWPRGLTKEALRADEWLKELAPTAELRRWYGHRPERYAAFAQAYRVQLEQSPQAARLAALCAAQPQGCLTLLCAARDPVHCNAGVLCGWLQEKLG